jgi:hypothetical protein
MGWEVNLVLVIEQEPRRIVVEIEEELGDITLGFRQRLWSDQVHCRMECME